MWLYRTGGDTKDAIVLYDYQPDRKTKRPAEFLKGFKGYQHMDGYEAYHSLGSGITVIARRQGQRCHVQHDRDSERERA